MDLATPGKPSRPFTLVTCTDCRGDTSDQVMERLREAVRSCPHAVLVATGCLGGLLRCTRAAGVHAAVQPCTEGRAPSGPVIRLGPLATEADAELVGAWLRAGMPDDGTLPRRLRAAPVPPVASPIPTEGKRSAEGVAATADRCQCTEGLLRPDPCAGRNRPAAFLAEIRGVHQAAHVWVGAHRTAPDADRDRRLPGGSCRRSDHADAVSRRRPGGWGDGLGTPPQPRCRTRQWHATAGLRGGAAGAVPATRTERI